MRRRRRDLDEDERGIPKDGRITIPTGQKRHTTAIREGKISSEVFCHNPKRREELGLPMIVVEE
jgi:hypothetical protein